MSVGVEDINLKFLLAFHTATRSESISEAASKLKIAQPALSRQLRLLEEQVGAVLFDRSHGGIQLTQDGLKFQRVVHTFFDQLSDVLDQINDGEVDGLIRVGSLTEIGQARVVPLLLSLQEKWPQLNFDVHFAKEFELQSAFQKSELDVIYTTKPAKGRSVYHEEVFREEAVLVTRSDHKKNVNGLAEVRSSTFVCYRREDPLLFSYLNKHYPTLKTNELDFAFCVNSHKSLIDILKASNCFALMPLHSVSDFLAAGILRIASERELHSSIYLSCSKRFHKSKLGQILTNKEES